MNNIEKLSDLSRRVVLALNSHHQSGAIEVGITTLINELGLTLTDIKGAIDELSQFGLLDRVDLPGFVSLSATGFRIAKILKSPENLLVLEKQGKQENVSIVPPDMGEIAQFERNLRRAFSEISAVISANKFDTEEDKRILASMNELIRYPAAIELLSSALASALQKKGRD